MRGRDGIEVEARSAWLITFRDGEQASLTLYQSKQEALGSRRVVGVGPGSSAWKACDRDPGIRICRNCRGIGGVRRPFSRSEDAKPDEIRLTVSPSTTPARWSAG